MRVEFKRVSGRTTRMAAALCVWCAAFVLALPGAANGVGARSGVGVANSSATVRAQRVSQAGEVVVILNEQFLNSLLDAITSQPVPPTFPLSRKGGAESNAKCASEITLLREAKGTRTAVRFRDDRITAQVAFRGSYAAPLLGCVKFEGWADAVFGLEFDRERQTFNARIAVREVSLKNVPSVMNSGLAGLVQEAIDSRINPVEILRAEQLGARIPVVRDNALRLRAADVRHEVSGKELRLRIVYEIVSAQ